MLEEAAAKEDERTLLTHLKADQVGTLKELIDAVLAEAAEAGGEGRK